MGAIETVSQSKKYSEASNIFHINLYFWVIYTLGSYITDQTMKMYMHNVIHYSIICNCKIFQTT